REARAARAQQLKGKPRTRKEQSAARRAAVGETREALKSTDVSKLPKNEREPELVYTRDLVDTRRNLAGSVWVVAVVYFIGTTVAGSVRNNIFQSSILFLSLFWFLAMIVDAYLMAKQIDSRVRARFPTTTVRVKAYAARRAFSLKRWRRPVPREVPTANRWDYRG
ncbi:MAG: DUF3043 domain-containing protein, partial [Mycobacteriales bacterium]